MPSRTEVVIAVAVLSITALSTGEAVVQQMVRYPRIATITTTDNRQRGGFERKKQVPCLDFTCGGDVASFPTYLHLFFL